MAGAFRSIGYAVDALSRGELSAASWVPAAVVVRGMRVWKVPLEGTRAQEILGSAVVLVTYLV